MNKKQVQFFEELSKENGLEFDAQGEVAFGKKDGYNVCIMMGAQAGQFAFVFSLSKIGELPNQKELKQVVKSTKSLRDCTVTRHTVMFNTKAVSIGAKGLDSIRESLDNILRFLQDNGYRSCCNVCGDTEEIDAYIVKGVNVIACGNCFAEVGQSVGERQQKDMRKSENIIGGIVGALLGSVIGAVVIVILGQLGYVAVISGIIMAVCTIKGYEILGGKMSVKGVIISSLVMIAMTFFAHRVDWAITIASYFEASVFDSMKAIPQLMAEGVIESGAYYGDLGLLYVFALIGAIPTTINALKAKKLSNIVRKMTSEEGSTSVSMNNDADVEVREMP